MKKFLSIMLGLALVLGTASATFGQDPAPEKKEEGKEGKKKGGKKGGKKKKSGDEAPPPAAN